MNDFMWIAENRQFSKVLCLITVVSLNKYFKMSPITQKFLVKILFMLSVGARFIDAKKLLKLPASKEQKEYIVASLCIESLPGYFDFSEEAIDKCIEDFGWHMDRDVSGVKVRCRSATGVTLEVMPSSNLQIVLLVPHPNDGDPLSVNYNILNRDSKYTDGLVIAPGTNYSVYSTVLDENGRPHVWHREISLQEWKVPEEREYHVQVKFNAINSSVEGLFSWNRTGELDSCFELDTICQKTPSYFYPTYKIWPGSPPSIDIKNLPANDSCTVKLRGMYGNTDFDFLTPAYQETQAEVKSNFTWVEVVNLDAEEDGDKWTVYVWWPQPPVTPDTYNVTLWGDNPVSTIVPGDATEAELRGVTGTGFYDVSVYAILGSKIAHNSGRAQFPRHMPAGAGSNVLRWTAAAGGAWVAAALAAALYWLRCCRANILPPVKSKVNIENKQLDIYRAEIARVDPQLTDAWEIKPERLTFHEVIGEGAFGVVRRGTLAPLGKEVAVKMLKDFPSMDEMRAFRVEMELMKSVGAHSHVVSLVGCCTTRQPAIVAEYCSRGDLLNFLRCSWDVMVSKRNANYYNNNINTSDYRNDLFKCKMSQEHSRLVVNKLYDLQGVCDTELTSLDLLSFCRQIAMGMEFLALNKVVHRDLAARNILVTRDRTLKIADFGLSRDVYEENQYKQKGNGKMPVKWMALESLTRRIYTTQSDVWSFGVVVWEVATVGGAPYAGVAAARLPRLLRAGYRMPRPPNCSAQLYELMQSCWAARPRDRPTFAELHARLDELLHSTSAAEYLSLELDDDPPPTPRAHRYLSMILRGKRSLTRGESYERPLKALHNFYSSPPVTYKTPI